MKKTQEKKIEDNLSVAASILGIAANLLVMVTVGIDPVSS